MKTFTLQTALLLSLTMLPALVQAQAPNDDGAASLYIGSDRAPIKVSTLALYQSYDDDGVDLSQLTLPVSVFVPVTPDLGFSVRTGYAMSDGTGMTELSGLADAQVGLSYHQSLGTSDVVVSVGANLPSGQSALTLDEAGTAFFVGQGFYGFRMPTLGQGFNVSPGITWATPIGENAAIGLGGSYQYRGSYEPREIFADTYDPGDEILVTAGVHLDAEDENSEFSAVAVDVSYIYYQADKWRGLSYETGNAVAVTGQWTRRNGKLETQVLGQVRLKGDSQIPSEAAALVGLDATMPSQSRISGYFTYAVAPHVSIGAYARGRHYAASAAFEEHGLVDIGLIPEYQIMPGLRLIGRLGGTFGSFTGFEAGGGLAWSM